MIHDVEVKPIPLADYAAVAHLSGSVAELRAHASALAPQLAGRTVWMVNSTARGGGVAEMMPREVSMLRELGVDTRWAAVDPPEPEFFSLTKRLHNLIHGSGDPVLSAADRMLYDRVSDRLADGLMPLLTAGDILVVHDPQPLGAGARARSSRRIAAVWRSHIGLTRSFRRPAPPGTSWHPTSHPTITQSSRRRNTCRRSSLARCRSCTPPSTRSATRTGS